MKRFLLIVFFMTLIGMSFFAGRVYAGPGPVYPPGRIPCPAGSEDPNFNSLRPYQASPCGGTVKALYCSNDLDFIEDFQVRGEGGCQKRGVSGTFTCDPNHHVAPHNLFVDLADSMFPIMGNTEQVQNSQTNTDTFTDATKVSEYASWYLNGVNNRAEYGDTKNTNDEIATFSGPIQKIMPQVILEAQRITTINSITDNVPQDPEDEDSPPAPQPGNHNQIVVCYTKPVPLLPYWLTNIFGIGAVGIGRAKPEECYNSPNRGTVLRLSSWDNNPFLSSIDNTIRGFLAKLLPPDILSQLLGSAFLDHWPKKIPPLPWSDKDGKPFASPELYQKAYNEWRGQLCAFVTLPIVGKQLLCAGLPGVTSNDYADLYPFVPLAQTVDKKGAEFISDVQFHPAGDTQISGQTYGKTLNAPLYFAHTEEVKDLSHFLNKSYTPKGVDSVPLPDSTGTNKCSSVLVRTNQGDNLFPGYQHGIEVDDVTYTITQARCTETVTWEPCSSREGLCKHDNLSCPAEVLIQIKTGTKTPFAKEIFSSTVADSGSTFRRIYPKVGNGAPVNCIADIPTVTNVTYSPKSTLDSGGNWTFKVKNYPADGGATPDSPQLTFPHIGSVYEYFLKGIQTALRPKGYGDPGPISGQDCSNIACGELPALPKASGSCNLGGVSSRVGEIPQSLKDIISAAAQTYKTPPNLILGIMYGEGLFNPGRFNWTDQNVKNWATCEKIPGCNETGDDNFMGFNGSDFTNIIPHILPDILKLDPTRKQLSQCNLLDTIYAEAYNLHASAAGGGGLPATCFGIPLSSTIPGSCSWSNSQYEAAIKVAESGYTKACFTLEGSCATGGGNAATCPGGDNCETISNRYTNPSHNGCVWDVGHGN